MLTWDVDQALSREAVAIDELADRLSECAGWRRLNDESSIELAREKIVIGPQDDPWDGAITGKATIDDLEEILLRANIHASLENPHEVFEPPATASCADEGGTIEIWIRRQMRRAEVNDIGLDACYLAFTDCVSSCVYDLQQKSDDGAPPRIRSVRVAESPKFGSIDSQSAQGVFMFATLEVDWGDRGGEL